MGSLEVTSSHRMVAPLCEYIWSIPWSASVLTSAECGLNEDAPNRVTFLHL